MIEKVYGAGRTSCLLCLVANDAPYRTIGTLIRFKYVLTMADEELTVDTVRKSMQHFMWIDYVIFVIMLTVCGGIGVYFGFVKKQKSTQDYLLGGRNMTLAPVCFSLVAR